MFIFKSSQKIKKEPTERQKVLFCVYNWRISRKKSQESILKGYGNKDTKNTKRNYENLKNTKAAHTID